MRSRLVAALLLAVVSCAQDRLDLSEAVAAGDIDRVETLLAQGVDPDLPVVDQLTPLMRAVTGGEAEIATLLIESGADVNAGGVAAMTAVHLAAVADSASLASALASAGAGLDSFDRAGMRPIDHAAHHGSNRVIETLISEHGIDPDATSQMFTQGHGYPRDRGPTPLAIAARQGQIETMRLLLDLGADVDARSSSGQTALLSAIFFDQEPEVVSLLLDAGADPWITARCIEGCLIEGDLSALEWAIELGRDELVMLLTKG